jgi:hypothetical protein
LVPSRYAVRIGDIDVLVVSDGVLPLPSTMLGYNADVRQQRRQTRICPLKARYLSGTSP